MPTTEATASPLQNHAAESAIPPVPKANPAPRRVTWIIGDLLIAAVMVYNL
jgi:hypothetical protein